MKQLLLLAATVLSLNAGCSAHELARTRWHELSGYKTGAAKLIEVEEGLVYLTPKVRISFVTKGREITRNWQEIQLAKNTFTAISVTRETFTFPLSDLRKIVAHTKVAGEITGIVPDSRGPPQGGASGGGMGRPMF